MNFPQVSDILWNAACEQSVHVAGLHTLKAKAFIH